MAGQVRHLKVKGGRFYARVAVPKSVQATLGRTELVTPIGGERRAAMSLSRSVYANRLRLAVAGAVELEELEALIGYAADDLDRKGLAPKVPRAELLRALAEVHLDALAVAEGRDEGRIRTPEPTSPLLTQPEPGNDDAPPVPLKKLFREYLASRQALGKHKDGARQWENAVVDLAKFVGHSDTRQITKRNLLDWRDHLLKSGKSAKTVANGYLAALRAVFRWAYENDRLPTNEAETVRQEVPKVQRSRERGYTTAEAVKVLKAATSYAPPVTDNPANRESAAITAAKRWLPVLGAFTGARPAELAQLRKQDVREEDGRWIIRISPDAGSVKAGDYRDVPLHPQVIELGFAAFAQGAKEGPLFHNGTKPERFLASARATAGRVSQWLQEKELVPAGVQPSHGWRHRFKTVAREIGADPRVVDAIQGHASKTAGDDYGDVSIAAKLRVIDALPSYKFTAG